MKRYRNSMGKQWSSLLTAFFISGCGSVAPGIQPGHENGSDSMASGSGDTDLIKTITPQLVASEKSAREKESVSDITNLVGQPSAYVIDSGDVLSIVVWDHPELAGSGMTTASATGGLEIRAASSAATFTVDHEGGIQFPYIGILKVGGLTAEAARAQLTTRLAYYINKPNVTFSVQSYRSKRVYVDGEVKTSGIQPITDIPMTLVEAINRAGGFLPTADQSQITLIRTGNTYRINLPQLVQRGVNPAEIILKNGDVVRVRPRDESKVFISGEVVGPRSILMHSGRLSLNEALGEAGGINPLSGDSRQVFVVRRTGVKSVVYRLDAYKPEALALAEGFELEAKDVVYVAATPLTNWQRTISQLLPGGLSSAYSAVAPPR